MKKGVSFIFIILKVVILVTIFDTLQAKIFNNSPILKIRENFNGGSTYYIDKGLFINHYYCTNNEEITVWKSTKYACHMEAVKSNFDDDVNEELLQCLESELDNYIITENDDLVEIPLSEIKKKDMDKIYYYKGVYASKHPDNMYVIVYPKNGTYDFNVMKDFEKYFYEKFFMYQKYEDFSIPTIYIHNSYNNVDFKKILNKCQNNSDSNAKILPSEITSNLKNTKKINIKIGNKELGTINDNDKISNILKIISSGKQYGQVFLCDNYAFNFEMYDNDNKLIDTIYVWYDGKRMIPASIGSKGCSYYSISSDVDLRKFIQEETDFVFYNILDLRDNDNKNEQLIYKDNNGSYYIKSDDTNDILIKFVLNNQIMTLKYALEKKFISAEKVSNEYPDILIKK